MDRFLAMALLLALTFSVNGIGWGRVEDWNRSSMALRNLGRRGMPWDYLKPPLHIFVTHIIVKAPIDSIEHAVTFVLRKRQNFDAARLVAARLLVVGLYLGTIVLAFEMSRVFYGIFAARVIAFVFATSAGFSAYNHFLSNDSPLLFWMMLAFYFAARITGDGQRIDYVMAGLLTGAATNAKYNGLAVGISLVAAHLLSARPKTWMEKLFGRDMIIGLFMVPAGIVLTDPYILFDWNRFVSDFMYNYVVTPRYGGQAVGGNSYWPFLLIIPEVLGLPGAILIAVGVIVSLVMVALRRRFAAPESLGFALALSVFALYYAKIGSFPRLGTRFVLPAVPFLILMAGPFLKAVEKHWRWLAAACAPILIYNCVCSYYVGKRFNDDPRMPAQVWMEANVKPGNRAEEVHIGGSCLGLTQLKCRWEGPPGKRFHPARWSIYECPTLMAGRSFSKRYSKETGGWKGKRQPMKGATTSSCSASKNCSRGIQTSWRSILVITKSRAKRQRAITTT